DPVVAGVAAQPVRACAAVQHVGAGVAVYLVVASVAVQGVVAGAAEDGIVAVATVQLVVVEAAVQRVVATRTAERHPAGEAGSVESVVTRATGQCGSLDRTQAVGAQGGAAAEAGVAQRHVAVGSRRDFVGAVATGDGVVARPSGKRVVTVSTEER